MLRLLWLTTVATAIIAVCQADTDFDKCDRSMCNQVVSALEMNLNFKIHPCDDFREHTCRSLSSTNRGPASVATGLNALNTMESRDPAIFRSILEENLSFNETVKALDVERNIFKSCRSYDLRQSIDKKRYYDNLSDKAKNLENLDRVSYTQEHWFGSDKNYAYKGFGYAFFDLKIVDIPAGRYIQIGPPTDNIMDISSLLIKKYDEGANRRSKYFQELKNFLNELNRIVQQKRGDEEEARQIKTLPLSSWNREWGAKANALTARIDWDESIKNHFTMVSVKAPYSNVEIVVKDEEYFWQLIKLLSNSNMFTIENYVNLRYISKTIGLVDDKYSEYSVIPAISNLRCTPGLFVGTAYAYAKLYFPKLNQDKLKEIFDAVKKRISYDLGSIKSNFDGAPLAATKDFLRKLNNANIIYGYPSWLLDEKLLETLYPDNFHVNERYFNNEESVYKSALKYNLNAYHDTSRSLIDMDELFNAFSADTIQIFERDTNDIVIPVRVFSEANFKFFSSDLFDPMNYASAGTLLATEIYQTWLKTVANTNNATDCMRYYLPRNRDLKREATEQFKNRATAYLMGLRTAYKEWPNKDSKPIEFDRFGAIYDSRLFFYSFAETLCLMMPNDRTKNYDVHFNPADYINAVVSNMEEFQYTFVCQEKSKMNGMIKCNPLEMN